MVLDVETLGWSLNFARCELYQFADNPVLRPQRMTAKTSRTAATGKAGGCQLWAETDATSDHADKLIDDLQSRLTATPPQPTYVVLARLMTVKTGQCRVLSHWKRREIRDLAVKLLK